MAIYIVGNPNSGPVWQTVADVVAPAGAYSQNVGQRATDPDGDTLTFSISPNSPTSAAQLLAAGLTLNASSGLITGTYDGTSSLTVIVRATEAIVIPSATLQTDWLRRSGQDPAFPKPGVVWFHDFRSDAEVNNFRWTGGFGGGNDPLSQGSEATLCRRITTDGMASGACLEASVLAGGAGQNSYWWRPYSPIVGTGNGRGVNDPGANGTITPKPWAPSSGSNTAHDFTNGWYGHPTYASADPTHFEGNEYYLQVVAKMDPRRITGGNAASTVGKFIWQTTTEGSISFSHAEHVCYSHGPGGNQGARNYLRMYAAIGGQQNPLNTGSRIQENSDSAADWYWSGGWDAVLFHLRPGLIGSATGPNCTHLNIWAARQGDLVYTKIWNQDYALNPYQLRNGLQALILGGYNNGFSFPQPFYHRYAQVIMSQQFVDCPQVWPA